MAFQLLGLEADTDQATPPSVRGTQAHLRLLAREKRDSTFDALRGHTPDDVERAPDVFSNELTCTEVERNHTQDDANIRRAPITEPPPSGVRRRSPRNRAGDPTDDDIIAAVRSGDQRVARLLHARLLSVVDLTLYRVFGRREPDHDDLIQAVFEQIVRTLNLNSYARACNLRTWAATLASHVAFTALRSRRRERRVFDRAVVLDLSIHFRALDGESAAAARHDLNHLRQHLIAMNPGRAQVLFLHDVQGEKLNEVAEALHITTAAATSRLVRARRELSQRLDLESARERRKQGLRRS